MKELNMELIRQARAEVEDWVKRGQLFLQAYDQLLEPGTKVEQEETEVTELGRPARGTTIRRIGAKPEKKSGTRRSSSLRKGKCAVCGQSPGWCKRGGCNGGAGEPGQAGAQAGKPAIQQTGSLRYNGELSPARVRLQKPIEMLRAACAAMSGEFSAVEVIAQIKVKNPGVKETQLASVYANLLSMLDRGELRSRGTGKERRYTVVKLKTSAQDVASEYNKFRETISVPRDPDAGQIADD